MVYQVADTLDADEGGVTLVAVVNIVLDAHLAQGTDTTDTEQQLLLQTVLPVTTIEVVGNLTILLEVGLVVRIQEVEVRTTYLAEPYTSRERTTRQSNRYSYPVTHCVTHGRDGQLVEVLRLVGSLLGTLSRQTLRKVTVAVQETYGGHRNVLVRSLLQVVTGQDTQTTRVDLQRRVQTVLHREVRNRRSTLGGLLLHVGAELRIDLIELREELLVLLELLQALHRQYVEEGDGVLVALQPELLINTLEQIAGVGVPAPPQVARQLLQCTQACRQGLVDHHAVPVGLLGEELLTDEVDLLVACTALAQDGAIRAQHGTLQSLGVSLLVEGEEVRPKGRVRDLESRLTYGSYLLLVHQAEAQQRVSDLHRNLHVVVIVATDHLDTRVLRTLVNPQTETGEGRRDGRYGESHRLERGVAPRLVVRRINSHVHTYQQLVIVLVEDAVVGVEVGGNKDHLHLRLLGRQDRTVQGVDNLIVLLVLQVVGRVLVLTLVDRVLLVLQVSLKIGAGTRVGSRYGDVGQYLTLQLVRHSQALERLHEDVQALVAELVATARTYDQRLLLELVTQASLSYLDHRLAGLLALLVELLTRPHDVVLEAVRRYAVGLAADQVLALVGRDVAHGAESIRVGGTHLLDRVLGHHVELAGQVIGVELRQVVVQGQVVTCNAAAHHRGVGREEGSDVGGIRTQVETTGYGHPLVEVSGNLICSRAEAVYVRSNYLTGSPTKEHRLHIVPLT